MTPRVGQRVLITHIGDPGLEPRLKVGQVHEVVDTDELAGRPGSLYVALAGDYPALVSGCGDRWLVDPFHGGVWTRDGHRGARA